MVVKIFTSIGVISTFAVGVTLLAIIVEIVGDAVKNHKYKKRLKNRFKGGTTAKCFCKDCRYYSETHKPSKNNHGVGDCKAHNGLVVSDCWYCWRSTPVECNEAKKQIID